MLIPNRHGNSPAYRYGFQGQEKDDEIKGGDGNSLNYTFRMHDPRVGRFFAVDPLTHKYPFYSPYQFSGNRVIDMVELEGLEPAVAGNREGQSEWALGNTPDHEIFSMFRQLVGAGTWYWHGGTQTTNAGWYSHDDYKEIIMPFALETASAKGGQIGLTWQESGNLLNQGLTKELIKPISSNLKDFLSRTFDGGEGNFFGIGEYRDGIVVDAVADVGAGRMRTINSHRYSSASGAITPLGIDDPFVFGIAGALRSKFFTSSNVFYTVQGADDSARLLSGGVPFPNGATKSFLGEGVYAFGSKSDAKKYKAMLQNFGAPDLEIMTFEVSNYSKLKRFDMRGLTDDAANIWLEGNSFPNSTNFQHVIRPAGNFDEYYFSSSIFNNIKFK